MGIALFPLQFLALRIYGSSFDVSSILIVLFINLLALKILAFDVSGKNKQAVSLILIFLGIQLLLFLINGTPLFRLVSGLIWFGGLLLVYLFKNDIKIDFRITHKIISNTLFITALVMIFEWFLHKRPKAFFDEPSYASVAIYSISSAYFGCFIFFEDLGKKKNKLYLLGCFYFFVGLLTTSMHIVSFTIVICLFLLIASNKRKVLYVFGSILIIYFASSKIVSFDNYYNRISSIKSIPIKNPSSYQDSEKSFNRSSMAWLDGYEQAKAALKINPIFGLGLGSSGYFKYDSRYNQYLIDIYKSNPNRFDSYSGFFRLIIELGLIFSTLVLLLLLKNILKIYRDRSALISKVNYEIFFIRFFSLTLFIGVLIKEPVYSRSLVYVATLLFSTSFIGSIKEKPFK
jgi:hypothetical protein